MYIFRTVETFNKIRRLLNALNGDSDNCQLVFYLVVYCDNCLFSK